MIVGTLNAPHGWQMPSIASVEEVARHRARFTLEPFERGHGSTLGAALRRVLLSSLRGCAPTWVRMAQVAHEQATPDGIGEDLVHLMLALKGVVFRMDDREVVTVTLRADQAGQVLAGDILAPAGVQVVNPEHVLARLCPGASLDLQIQVERGRGHRAGQWRRHPGEITVYGPVIVLDASFSPVRRVDYAIEPLRVGPRSDLERLVLDIQTDGSMPPLEALQQAARLLMGQLDPLAGPRATPDTTAAEAQQAARERTLRLSGLIRTIDELNLTARSSNCLKSENIYLLGDLIQRTETELLRAPNLGRKSLNEIKQALAALGFTLGSVVQDWPPPQGRSPH